MANWISIKEAAAKYGTTEDKIHYLIRLRYVAFSFLNDTKLGGEYDDKLLMVNDDELNEILDFNVVPSLMSDSKENPVVRIPLDELNSLLQINDNFREVNKNLLIKLEVLEKKEGKRRGYKIIVLCFILIFSLCLIFALCRGWVM